MVGHTGGVHCWDVVMVRYTRGWKAYLRLHWLVGGKVHTVVWNVHSLVLLHWLIGVQRPGGDHLQRERHNEKQPH